MFSLATRFATRRRRRPATLEGVATSSSREKRPRRSSSDEDVTPRPDEVHSTCNCRGTYVHQVPL